MSVTWPRNPPADTGEQERKLAAAWLRARAAHHRLCHEAGVTAINHHSAALVVTEYADGIERGEHMKDAP
jgi:hypothetical protein